MTGGSAVFTSESNFGESNGLVAVTTSFSSKDRLLDPGVTLHVVAGG